LKKALKLRIQGALISYFVAYTSCEDHPFEWLSMQSPASRRKALPLKTSFSTSSGKGILGKPLLGQNFNDDGVFGGWQTARPGWD
jgi:hypothetical protein